MYGYEEFNCTYIREDVKTHWLQPPYSAAASLYRKNVYIAVECCSIVAAASSVAMNFDVFPNQSMEINEKLRIDSSREGSICSALFEVGLLSSCS